MRDTILGLKPQAIDCHPLRGLWALPWFEEFDADAWYRQIERDAREGILDSLAEGALAECKAVLSGPPRSTMPVRKEPSFLNH